MRFATATTAVLTLLSTTSAVVLGCRKSGLDPYCCNSMFGIPLAGLSLGLECKKQIVGTNTECANNQVKACCEQKSLSVGQIVTFCQTEPQGLPFIGSIPGLPGLQLP